MSPALKAFVDNRYQFTLGILAHLLSASRCSVKKLGSHSVNHRHTEATAISFRSVYDTVILILEIDSNHPG